MAGRGTERMGAAARWAGSSLRRAAVYATAGLRAVWAVVRPPLSFALQVIAALVLLFEEWGWRPLVEALGYLSRFKLFAWVERQKG